VSRNLDILMVAYHARTQLSDALASVALWARPGYRLTVYENGPGNYPLTWVWNRFVEGSGRRVVALCNPDIILGEGWDEEVLAALEDPSVGVASPLCNHPPHAEVYDPIVPDEMALSEMPDLARKAREAFPPGTRHLTQDHRMATGACYVLRRETWERLGGFNESVPFAGNDYDFSARAVAGGMKLAVCPRAVCHHRWNSCSKEGAARGTFNVEANQPHFGPAPLAPWREI